MFVFSGCQGYTIAYCVTSSGERPPLSVHPLDAGVRRATRSRWAESARSRSRTLSLSWKNGSARRSGAREPGAEWSRLHGLLCLRQAQHSFSRSAPRTRGGGSIRAALTTATHAGAPLNSSRARCRCTCEWRSARTPREARAGVCGLAPCSWRAGSSAKRGSCRCKAAGCWSWAAAWGYLRSRQRSWAPRASPRTACLCCCARWSAARARTTGRGARASRSWTGTMSPRAP